MSKMLENEDLLREIMERDDLSYIMNFGSRSYSIDNLYIAKGIIPVRKPTTRGGVYFTDTTAYKVKATLSDLSIKEEIPKLMLGPNADFTPIHLVTNMHIGGSDNTITIISHLTNSVYTKEKVELNLIVDRIDLRCLS